MKHRKNKPARWSRKGHCPSCNVATGSRHSKECTINYNNLTTFNSVKKETASKVEYVVCILIAISFILVVIFAAIQSEKETKDAIAQQVGCDFNLKEYVAKENNNQEIINYLYESDMRGEIRLDSQTLFWLGRIN